MKPQPSSNFLHPFFLCDCRRRSRQHAAADRIGLFRRVPYQRFKGKPGGTHGGSSWAAQRVRALRVYRPRTPVRNQRGPQNTRSPRRRGRRSPSSARSTPAARRSSPRAARSGRPPPHLAVAHGRLRAVVFLADDCGADAAAAAGTVGSRNEEGGGGGRPRRRRVRRGRRGSRRDAAARRMADRPVPADTHRSSARTPSWRAGLALVA
jgi:hypothetical protein